MKYRDPCTSPSFLPSQLSSSTPTHTPAEKWVGPTHLWVRSVGRSIHPSIHPSCQRSIGFRVSFGCFWLNCVVASKPWWVGWVRSRTTKRKRMLCVDHVHEVLQHFPVLGAALMACVHKVHACDPSSTPEIKESVCSRANVGPHTRFSIIPPRRNVCSLCSLPQGGAYEYKKILQYMVRYCCNRRQRTLLRWRDQKQWQRPRVRGDRGWAGLLKAENKAHRRRHRRTVSKRSERARTKERTMAAALLPSRASGSRRQAINVQLQPTTEPPFYEKPMPRQCAKRPKDGNL